MQSYSEVLGVSKWVKVAQPCLTLCDPLDLKVSVYEFQVQGAQSAQSTSLQAWTQYYFDPHLRDEKTQLRDGNQLTPTHIAIRWQCQDSNPGLVPEPLHSFI